MGFKTVAIARGQAKEPLVKKLGACSYIDSQAQDPSAELQKLGGAKVILATVTAGDAMSATQGGARHQWNFGGDRRSTIDANCAPSFDLRSAVGERLGISAQRIGSQETLAFSLLSGVRSMNEVSHSKSSGSLRTDDERKGAVSRGVDNGLASMPLRQKGWPGVGIFRMKNLQ